MLRHFYLGGHRFCPQFVGVVKVSNEFGAMNETISAPGEVGPPHGVRWDRDVVPRRTTRCELVDMPQPVSNQSVGLRFSRRVGSNLSEGSAFSFPV